MVVGFDLATVERAAAQAQADDATRAAARNLGEQGIQAYRANDFATADAKLDRAYRLFSTPTLALWGARARVKLGNLVEAAERYRDALRASDAIGDSAAQKDAQKNAAKELDALSPRIPSLTIQLDNAEPSEVTITLDDAPISSALIGVPRPTNPGQHQLVAKRGDERYEKSVQLLEKEQESVRFEFRKRVALARPGPESVSEEPARDVDPFGEPTQPTAAEAKPQPAAAEASSGPSALKPLGIVLMAVGGAGLATAGVTALLANGKLDQCPDKRCESQSVKNSYDTLKLVSTISVYGGAALAVGGLLSFLLAPSDDQQNVSWNIGPSGVTVNGKF